MEETELFPELRLLGHVVDALTGLRRVQDVLVVRQTVQDPADAVLREIHDHYLAILLALRRKR